MDLREAVVVIGDYRRFYRDERPHSSLDYRTPGSFAALCQQVSPGRHLTANKRFDTPELWNLCRGEASTRAYGRCHREDSHHFLVPNERVA